MTPTVEGKRIVVIDCQAHWRQLSIEALKAEGFKVDVLDNYDFPPVPFLSEEEKPDLVILGCASIKPEELELIKRILDQKLHLLVLSTSLPWQVMRHLFLAGADDVTDKPYNPEHLVNIVTELFKGLSPRDSFHLAARQGKS